MVIDFLTYLPDRTFEWAKIELWDVSSAHASVAFKPRLNFWNVSQQLNRIREETKNTDGRVYNE